MRNWVGAPASKVHLLCPCRMLPCGLRLPACLDIHGLAARTGRYAPSPRQTSCHPRMKDLVGRGYPAEMIFVVKGWHACVCPSSEFRPVPVAFFHRWWSLSPAAKLPETDARRVPIGRQVGVCITAAFLHTSEDRSHS
jgi:hypothetical protein